MKPYTQQLEGTWEEILTHADELAGRKVRLIVLPADADAPFESAGGSTADQLLLYTRQWSGDDLLERLRDVYETRTPTFP